MQVRLTEILLSFLEKTGSRKKETKENLSITFCAVKIHIPYSAILHFCFCIYYLILSSSREKVSWQKVDDIAWLWLNCELK